MKLLRVFFVLGMIFTSLGLTTPAKAFDPEEVANTPFSDICERLLSRNFDVSRGIHFFDPTGEPKSLSVSVARLVHTLQEIPRKISSTTRLLNTPDQQRPQHLRDPRFFLIQWFTPASSNPINQQLTADQEKLQTLEALARQAFDMAKEADQLVKSLKKIKNPDDVRLSSLDVLMLEWLIVKTQTIAQQVAETTNLLSGKLGTLTGATETAATLEPQIQENLENIQAFRTYLATQGVPMPPAGRSFIGGVIGEDPDLSVFITDGSILRAHTPLLQKMIKEAVSMAAKELQAVSEKELGSPISESTAFALITLSVRFNEPASSVLSRFVQIRREAQKILDAGSHRTSLPDEQILVLLTHTIVRRGILLNETEVAKRFFEMDRIGESTKEGFHIHDLEVAVLTDLSFEWGHPDGTQVMQRFFELERHGREVKSDFHFNDPALVVLTRLSFTEGASLAPQQLAQSFVEIYDNAQTVYGKTLDDLTVALLLEGALKYGNSGQPDKSLINSIVLENFIALKKALEEKDVAVFNDAQAARLSQFATQAALTPETLAGFLKQMATLNDSKVPSTQRAMTLLTYARQMEAQPSDETLNLVLALPRLFQMDQVIDHLREPERRSSSSSSRRLRAKLGDVLAQDDDDNFIWRVATGDMMGTGIPGGIDMDFKTPF